MLIRFLLTALRPHRRAVAVIGLLQLAQTLASLLLPTLNGDLIDNGLVHGDTGYVLRTGIPLLGATLAQIVCSIGVTWLGTRVATAVGGELRSAIFRQVQRFSAREIGRFGTASLLTRTTNDVQQVQMLLALTFTLLVAAPIMCVGGVVLALDQDVPLSVTLLVAVPVLGAAAGLIVARMSPLARWTQTRIDAINRILAEQITGLRVVRAFVQNGREQRRFTAANAELTDVSVRVGRLTAYLFPTVLLALNASSVTVLWLGAHRVASGAMRIGSLTAFLTYLAQILMAVTLATSVFALLPRAHACAERITEVLDTESSVRPPARPVRPATVTGLVELRNVGLRFPGAGQPVLDGVTLRAGPGETVAVTGNTGSGKTTLANLIARLLDPTGGAVLLDGVDIRDLDPALLVRSVGLVSQRPHLFSGTIATNLRHGRPDATDDQLWQALRVARADDFVARLPGGLDAVVGPGGGNLSGGQRQRVAIARTLIRQPAVYVFDDCFSAVDTITERALRTELAGWTRAATVIVVAQRISTVRHADRIVVLDQGRIAGIGSHTELMAANPTYRDIVLSQLDEREAA